MTAQTIDPAGMTLARALEIATACLPAAAPVAPDRADRVAELHGQGMTDGEIADAAGIPRGAVRKIRDRLGLQSNHTIRLASGNCSNGHPWTAENSYVNPKDGRRRCRECGRDSYRKTRGR